MNRELIIEQQNFFIQNKQREIEKWVKDVNKLNEKSVYSLTWSGFYKELHQLGIKGFLRQYGFSSKKKLQLLVAKSNLWQKKVTLYDFEKSKEFELKKRLGNNFFNKVTRQPNFDAKKHKLSTIHYYIYHYNLNFAALSLGFSSKQSFLNFFAQTLYMPEHVGNMAQKLRISIQSLQEIDPATLRETLSYIYDQPLIKNIHFIKYNYTLEELKLTLENEDIVLVVASLGSGNAFYANKKLQTLSPIINTSLQDLKQKSWVALIQNAPILLWQIKLYQLFLRQMPLECICSPFTFIPRPLRPSINFYGQFFTLQPTQILTEDHRICSNGDSIESSACYSSLTM